MLAIRIDVEQCKKQKHERWWTSALVQSTEKYEKLQNSSNRHAHERDIFGAPWDQGLPITPLLAGQHVLESGFPTFGLSGGIFVRGLSDFFFFNGLSLEKMYILGVCD